jgi:hypothetical protein
MLSHRLQNLICGTYLTGIAGSSLYTAHIFSRRKETFLDTTAAAGCGILWGSIVGLIWPVGVPMYVFNKYTKK